MSVIQADAIQPWDKRPKETPRAFQMFTHYRDAGPARSLRKVAAETATTLGLVSGWSAEHDWVDRSAAWDQQLDRERQAEQVEEIRTMHRRHAALATQMMAKAIEKVRAIEGEKLSVREAILLIDLAVRMERQARGEASLAVQLSGSIDVQGPTGSAILKALRDAPQLLEFADELDAVLEAEAAGSVPD